MADVAVALQHPQPHPQSTTTTTMAPINASPPSPSVAMDDAELATPPPRQTSPSLSSSASLPGSTSHSAQSDDAGTATHSSPPTSPGSSSHSTLAHDESSGAAPAAAASYDDVKPAYFYPASAGDSPNAAGIPVFHPKMAQFADFYKYCQAIDSWGMKTGIVKVVPPKEWLDGLPSIRAPDVAQQEQATAQPPNTLPTLEGVRIKSAIAQHFTPAAKPGLWRQTNVTRPAKVWNVKQWSEVCKGMCGPSYDRIRDLVQVREKIESGEQVGDQDEPDGVRTRSGKTKVGAGGGAATAPSDAIPPKKRRRVEEHQQRPADVVVAPAAPQSDDEGVKTPPVWTPLAANRKRGEGAEGDEEGGDGEGEGGVDGEDAPQASPSRAAAPAARATAAAKVKTADLTTPAEWSQFDYRKAWLDEWAQGSNSQPHPSDWTPEMCREIEGEYWRNLNFGQPPMYGADLKGTLFTPQTQSWNVNRLDNLLTRLKLKRKIAGVTDPYLYFGMWRATFAWHVEDMDLYSINYLHFGAPKQWYSIPQKDRLRFETILSSAFPSDARRCSQFMRHKSFLASPSFLAANNIRPLKMVQHAGEFVITYPFGYHSGFNLGFNCAESVNFALENWLDIGRKAKACECEDAQQSVVMDVDALLQESQELEMAQRRREQRQRKRGVGDDDGAAAAEAEAAAERRRAQARARRAQKKQARGQASSTTMKDEDEDDWAEDDLPELRLLSDVASGALTSSSSSSSSSMKLCCLCPLDSTEDIVPVGKRDDGDDGDEQQLYAHVLCANSIPECWVAPVDEDDEASPLEVKGYWNINKSRWALKCTLCTTPALSKAGCCAQCTFGNCARAVHPSCAAMDASGWFMDMLDEDEADKVEMRGRFAAQSTKAKGRKSSSSKSAQESSVDTPSGEAGSERMVILCRAHNPITRAKDRLRKSLALRESIKHLQSGSQIKVRYSGGGKYETRLLELRDGGGDQQVPDGLTTLQQGVALVEGPPERTVSWDQIVMPKDVQDQAVKKVSTVLDSIERDMVKVEGEADASAATDASLLDVLARRAIENLDQAYRGHLC